MTARRLHKPLSQSELRNHLELALHKLLKRLSEQLERLYPISNGNPPVTITRLTVGQSTYLLTKLPQPPLRRLTNLQVRILRRIAEGLPNKAIADELNCSHHTVASHLKRLHKKLKVHSRYDLIWKSLALT